MAVFAHSLALADISRISHFSIIGSARRLLNNPQMWIDDAGLYWAAARYGTLAFGITSRGPGWVFDAYAQRRRADEFVAQMKKLGTVKVSSTCDDS